MALIPESYNYDDWARLDWQSIDDVSIVNLVGRTIETIEGLTKGSKIVAFGCTDGTVFFMHHVRDCCEDVDIEDIVGDVADLIGTPVLTANENVSKGGSSEQCSTWTATHYDIATIKGNVTIRWIGASNSYYSESVDFSILKSSIPTPC